MEKVPQVSVEILEDGDSAIGLDLGLADEDYAVVGVVPEVPPEVVGEEEEEYTAAGLVPDACRLFRCGRLGEQDAATGGARRRDEDPALGLFGDGGVLDQGEAQLADVEGQGLLIVADDKGDLAQGLATVGMGHARRAFWLSLRWGDSGG